MAAHNVHLVGSIPFETHRKVFETVGAALGDAVLRMPDGELGERLTWLPWLDPVFSENPAFEPTETIFQHHAAASKMRHYRLRDGVNPDDVNIDGLRYAEVAEASYKTFTDCRAEGAVPENCRFQVSIPHPVAAIRHFVWEEDQNRVEAAVEQGFIREVEKIAERIPSDDLAIQWDIASAVFEALERGEPTRFGNTKQEMYDAFAARVARMANAVPQDVELLLHLCYGDSGHKHAIEPTDMSDMVEMVNRISPLVERSIDLIHMPVPRDRDDDAYFAPLKSINLKPGCRLSIGLVHHSDGTAGTRGRLKTAYRYVDDFLIATECGFGRRQVETINELLDIHAEIARDG